MKGVMRRKSVGFIAAVVIGMALHGAARAQQYTIRFSAPIESRTDISSQSAVVFQQEVEKGSHGRIKVQLFFGSQLGTLPAITDQMKDGTIQMNAVGFPFLAKYVPDVGALGLPFLFKNGDDAHKVMDGPIGDDVRKVVQQRAGIRILAIGEFGFVSMLNAKRPITTPADMKDLKIRTTPSPVAIATFRQLGAIPLTLDFAEIYTGMQRGALDGTDQTITSVYDVKLYEVAKHFTETRHFFQALCFNINEKFFETLPADLQAVVQQAALKARDFNRRKVIDEEANAAAKLSARGVRIVELDPAQLDAFRAAVKPIYADAKSKFGFGADGIRWVDQLTTPH